MTAAARRAWLGAVIVIVLALATGPPSVADPNAAAQDRWTDPTADGQTTTTGVFSGEFGDPTIVQVTLTVTNQQPADGCAETTTATQDVQSGASTTTSTAPPTGSVVSFFFDEGSAVCNGVYDVHADASGKPPNPVHPSLQLANITIAVPAPPPTDVTATMTARTVDVSWQPPAAYATTAPPADFQGYRISRVDASSGDTVPLGLTPPTVTTFNDAGIDNAGGTFRYRVESVRAGASSDLGASSDTVTLASDGSGGPAVTSPPGPSAKPPAGTTPRTAVFDPSTLAAGDDVEPGADDPVGQAAGDGTTVQRFRDSAGAGLVKPFATAFVLLVWAMLLAFVSRRASRADRLLRVVEVEHAP